MEWRDNLNEGNEIKNIVINIEYIYIPICVLI